MSLLEQYRAFAGYNAWMNRKLYETAAGLDDADRHRDLGAFFGSIHGTLNHMLLTDRSWLGRFTGNREISISLDAQEQPIPIRGLGQELYEDFAELRRQRARTDRDIELWVGGLDEASLEAPLRYRTSAGREYSHPLWWAVGHFFNHQTHHRGQVAALLTRLGHDPGVTDLVVFLRDRPG